MSFVRDRRARSLVSSISFMLTALVVAGCVGTAGAPPPNAPVDVSGEWEGRWTAGAGVGGFRMSLHQAGAIVNGDVVGPTFCGPSGALTGVVTATSLKWTAGCLSGLFWVAGDTMTGRITSAVIYEVTAVRKK